MEALILLCGISAFLLFMGLAGPKEDEREEKISRKDASRKGKTETD